jgi:hypothetical protein
LGQKYFEITDNFTWYLPSHTITAGVRVDFLKFRNLFISDNFGAYAYSSIARFLQDLPANGAVGFTAYTYKYSATADPLQQSIWGARQYGFYLQDEYTVTSRLKLTAGIRMDLPTYPDMALYNKAVDSTYGLRTDLPPKSTPAFSPRVGFNLSLDEERTMQVRGGAGIFYGRFPYVWVGNQYAGTGVDFVTINNIPARFNPDPNGQAKAAAAASATYEISVADRNFKAPSVIRGSLAFDYKLPFDLVASVEGIYSVTQNDAYYENVNLAGMQENGGLTPGGRLAGENREVWGVWNASRRGYAYRNLNQPPRTDTLSTGYQPVNARFAPGVFVIKNTDKGSNANVIVQIQRAVAEGVNGGVSYTWGLAKDINSGNSTTASSGWRFNPTPGNPNAPQLTYSQWDRRHHIMANVSYRHDWSGSGYVTTLGLIYNGLSGRPFSYLVVGDVNGDGRSDNDLVYIPKDADDIILMGLQYPDSAAGPNNPTIKLTDKTRREYGWLMNFINSDEYLKANKGKIAQRSGPREPWTHQLDLHFAQEIPTYAGQKIEFTFDVTNFLNLLNSDWGWVRNTGINQNYSMITFHSIETATGADRGKPRYTVAASSLKVTDGKADPFVPDNLLSRWQAQFGIRYTF